MSLCDERLRTAILDQLFDLKYHALLQAIAQLLERMGYEEVRLAGRTGLLGRNSGGGCDLTAVRSVHGGKRKVVVQVKQCWPSEAVYGRAVHELRGVCVAQHAAEAVLITTSRFSPSVEQKRHASAPTAPVRFIDGAYLADLLALYRIGVKRVAAAEPRAGSRLELDPSYFDALQKRFAGGVKSRPGTRRIDLVISVRHGKGRA